MRHRLLAFLCWGVPVVWSYVYPPKKKVRVYVPNVLGIAICYGMDALSSAPPPQRLDANG